MYSNKLYEDIKSSILSRIESMDKREGSVTADMISPIAMELEAYYQELTKALGIMFLEDSTGTYLEKRAGEYGIKRKSGTNATGAVVFTGSGGTTIPKGSLVATATGLIYQTTVTAMIPEQESTVAVPIVSQGIGGKYNVIAGTITKTPVSIIGVFSVSNPEETKGGTDIETDAQLLSRVLYMLQNPATSGNATHYKLWAMEVAGIGDAKVFPLHSGNGTVMVMPITTAKQAPPLELIERVQKHIDAMRPIGASVTVTAPLEVPLNVTATVIPISGYTAADIEAAYLVLLKQYVSESIFKLSVVDYYRCLSMMYDLSSVQQVVEFRLNGGEGNIVIQPTEIQAPGTVIVSVQ